MAWRENMAANDCAVKAPPKKKQKVAPVPGDAVPKIKSLNDGNGVEYDEEEDEEQIGEEDEEPEGDDEEEEDEDDAGDVLPTKAKVKASVAQDLDAEEEEDEVAAGGDEEDD